MSRSPFEEWERERRVLMAKIADLEKELAREQWDRSHYHDLFLLRCGVTCEELTPLSHTLRLDRQWRAARIERKEPAG
jgi:hypothetical protein